MAAPLIVAGAKVAGKAIAKKVAAKQAAKIAAKKVATKAGTKIAEKGTQKVAQKTVASKLNQAKNIYNKAEKIQDIHDTLTPEKKEEEKPVYKKNILNRFLGNQPQQKDKENINIDKKGIPEKFNWRKTFGLDKTKDTESNVNEQPAENKFAFYAAMFFALIKDAIEIFLTAYLLGWLIPVLSFFPTIILTAILFLSGKKGTMKMVFYLVALFIDYFFPGINVIPITSIATFITFKLTPSASKDINSGNINKGLNIIKSFIK